MTEGGRTMARRYARDSSGRFASSGSHGDRAETVQQNKAKKGKEDRAAEDRLEGNKVGFDKNRRGRPRRKVVGNKATTKAAQNAYERSKKRTRS